MTEFVYSISGVRAGVRWQLDVASRLLALDDGRSRTVPKATAECSACQWQRSDTDHRHSCARGHELSRYVRDLVALPVVAAFVWSPYEATP